MTSICWDSTVIIRWRFRVSSFHKSSKLAKLAQYLFPGDDLFPLSLSLQSRDNLNALTRLQAPNHREPICPKYRGYYTVARRYEFYVRVTRTVSHSFAALTREIFVLATRT